MTFFILLCHIVWAVVSCPLPYMIMLSSPPLPSPPLSSPVQLNLTDMTKTAKKEINSVSLDFEIPMYICSGMCIRFLRVFERGKTSYTPYRWVRYITHRLVCSYMVTSFLLRSIEATPH